MEEELEAQADRKGVPLPALIEELQFFTGCDDATARALLHATELELHAAVDAHFERQRGEAAAEETAADPMPQRGQGTATPPPLPALSLSGAPPEQDTGFSKRITLEPEPEPELEPKQPTFRVLGRSILRAGPELQSAVVRELSVGEVLVATDIVLLPSALPPTPSALTDARLFAAATRPRIRSADTGQGSGWSSLRANNGTLLLEELLPAPDLGDVESQQGLSVNSPDVSFVCTLRSPSLVLAQSAGGIAGRVLLYKNRLVWHNASTPTKIQPLGASRAGGLASSINIPYARIGAVTVAKEKAQQLVYLELQLPRAHEVSGSWKGEQQQHCLLGSAGRWCLGFGTDTQRRSVFLRALGQAIIDAHWIPAQQRSPSARSSACTGDGPLIAPEYCGYTRCSDWLSIRARAAMDNVSVELAQQVAQFQAEVIASAQVASRVEAERLLREGRDLVCRVRDTVFMQERGVMKSGLLTCPAWQEGGCRTIQGSAPQRTIRCDGFVRLLSVGGGLLPAEAARGRRYLLLRADTPTLEIYKERHPEAAVPALASLPLALFQEDDVVANSLGLGIGSSEPRSSSTSESGSRGGSTSSILGETRTSNGARASSSSTASSGCDIETVRVPPKAIEAGMTAAAGLQHDDCWSGSWGFEKVEEVSLTALSTWGQVTRGRDGAPDTLAVVNGAGHAFEMQLPSAGAAVRWKTELLAAARGQATSSSSTGPGLQSYLARGRRGGISGLSKSGWFWCERGRAGGGRWARRWLELDPDGQLRIYTKEAAKAALESSADSSQVFTVPPAGKTGRGSVVKVDCESATIRPPKNVRKDHPHAFRLEATRGAKESADSGQDLKFILEPMGSNPVNLPHIEDAVTVDTSEGTVLVEEESEASAAYKAAFGVRDGKSVEEDAAEWVEAIRVAGAAAAARNAQRQMALDDDVDSVLLGTIKRLSEEAVLLPVLEPLLKAAAATAAPAFGNSVQTAEVSPDQISAHHSHSLDGQPLEAAAVRWLRSELAVGHTNGQQEKQPGSGTEGEQHEDWIALDEEAASSLEAAYLRPGGDGSATVSLHVGQISDVESGSSSTKHTVRCKVDFANMLLTIADGDENGTSVSEQRSVFKLQRQETALHTALRLTRHLPQEHQVFSLRPAYRSPTLWADSLRCFRGLGGADTVSAAPGGAVSCSGNVSLLPGAIEEHLVRLRDEINAQYIAERLLPDRDPEAAPLPSRVLGADDLLPILCFLLARGADVETTRSSHTRLTTLLAWCCAMADGGGGEGEWMAQAMHSALTHLIEDASAPRQLVTAM